MNEEDGQHLNKVSKVDPDLRDDPARNSRAKNVESKLDSDSDSSDRDEQEQKRVDASNEKSFRVKRGKPPARIGVAADLLGEELVARAIGAGDKLKSHLSGTILIKVRNGKNFLFTWTGGEPKCEESSITEAECVLELADSDLVNIANGKLNPQIAMLSDKIKVSGRSDLAIYFFNLAGNTSEARA